jgi:hypothetical protein
MTKKDYWENIYATKNPQHLSWTQEFPKTSMDFIHSFRLKKSAKIIDIGGGDSKLVDCLLEEGFQNITILDISSKALEKAKQRLGSKAEKINWIVTDILKFQPESSFDVWHDRATFHFLTSKKQVIKYMNIAREFVSAYLAIATFSKSGPKSCSGFDIEQYSEESLSAEFNNGFDKLKCVIEDHITPFETRQSFLFCSFKRRLI